VANLVEGSETRRLFERTEIPLVGWGKKRTIIIPRLGSIEVFDKLDTE